jgi:hypothetical protein
MRTSSLLVALSVWCPACAQPNPTSPTEKLTKETGDGSMDTGTPIVPGPYTAPATEALPELSTETLQTGAEVAVAALANLRPALVYDGYASAIAHANGACPGLFPAVGLTTGWSNTCTTPEGWGFEGRSQTAWLGSVEVDGLRLDRYGEFITTATLRHPEGAELILDGRGEYRVWREGDLSRMEATLDGSFLHVPGADPWLDGGWLDEGPSIALRLEGQDGPSTQTFVVEGGISRWSSLPPDLIGFRFEGLELTSNPEGCVAQGDLVLQGTAGQRLRLHLPAASPCESCAPTTNTDGTSFGEVCVNLGPLVEWESRPW